MKRCCVPHCRNTGAKGFSIFRAPAKPQVIRQRWLLFLKSEGWKFDGISPNNIFVCELHFAPEDLNYFTNKKQIKRNAVPSIGRGASNYEYTIAQEASDDDEEEEDVSVDPGILEPKIEDDGEGMEFRVISHGNGPKELVLLPARNEETSQVQKTLLRRSAPESVVPPSTSAAAQTSRLRKKVVPLRENTGSFNGTESPEKIQPAFRIASAVSITQNPLLASLQLKNFALEKENKRLKSVIRVFVSEAQDIQEKLMRWTQDFQSILSEDDEDEEEHEAPFNESQTQFSMPNVLNSSHLEAEKGRLTPTPKQVSTANRNKEAAEKARRLMNDLKVAKTAQLSKSITITRNPATVAARKPDAAQDRSQHLPHFPIKEIDSFVNFEKNLMKPDFFRSCFQHLVSKHKPSLHKNKSAMVTLKAVLTEIISLDIFNHFAWKRNAETQTRRLKMTDFPKFMSLFLSLSLKLYSKRWPEEAMQPLVKQILRGFILRVNNDAAPRRPNAVQSTQPTDENPKPATPVVLNYDLNRNRSESPAAQPKDNEEPTEPPNIPSRSNSVLSEDTDFDQYLIPETVMESINEEAGDAVECENGNGGHQQEEDESDIEDITPAPISIEIPDDSD